MTDVEPPPEVTAKVLLETPSVTVRDIRCRGDCQHASPEECAAATELVFPYRGVYARQVGRTQAIAEANQALFFNADEGYRVSHPVSGGDACLSLKVAPEILRELAPKSLLQGGPEVTFAPPRVRIDARTQALVALVRHGLVNGAAEPLEAESLALTLVGRALGPRTAHTARATVGRQKLADRAKLVLAADLARRWTLAEIAAEVGGSPVYLTQVFQQVEGLPLYRYQLRLRLARALDRLPDCDDLTGLALDLGFSSHSHFSAAFKETYGRSPSAFRQAATGADH
ncbi:MAG: AraC family transcriptional regulator [Phenylobacterium sp.]